MVVVSHPDDTEIYAGGTIARLTADGKEVRVIKMTSGNKGSRQEKISENNLRKIRMAEDAVSMKILGVKKKNNICLDLGDGQVEDDLKTIGKLAEQIRIFKPELIISHNPEHVIIRFDAENSWVNHRDHRHTGQVALDAGYPYSRDVLFFPEHFTNKDASSHAVTEFLLVDYYDHSDVVGIDITNFVETRVHAIAAHKSQYSLDHAKDLANFFLKPTGGNFERFRYMVAD